MGPVLMLCKPRKRILESELPINDASTKHKLGKLVYVSGAPLPTPDEITERTLKQYGHISDSGLDSNHNQSAKPEPVAISASCRLQDAICSNIDILFRGPILEDWLDNNKDNLPRKVPIMSWVSSAPNAVMSPIDVPPMPPSIPNVSNNPTNPVKDPIPNLAKRLADTGALSSTTPAVLTRQRPPPIVVISAPRSSHVGSGNPRCFNSSPLKQSSLPSPATSSKSSPCSPELQTPPPSSSAALSEIGLMQSMWAPKD